jgi:hypothetical protein
MSRTASTLPVPETRTRKPRSKKKAARSGWKIWWPVLLGILVTPLALRAAAIMALEGPDALRMLYPFVALLKLHALGLPEELAGNLSQLMMYLQFPLYGLVMSLLLRITNVFSALLQTAALHLVTVGFLIAIAHM